MAALGQAFLGHLAQRAPPPPPPPVPTKVSDLILPPPAPPPQGLPPLEPQATAAAAAAAAGANDPFSIQTIGVDVPAGLPPAPSQAKNNNNNGIVVEVTMTPTPAAAPAAAPTTQPPSPPPDAGGKGAEGDAKGPGHKQPPSGECRLMGPFAIFVQLGLGGLALMSLVYKRWRERPQRPVKIWFFDVSKQVFGSVLVHMANVFMSLLTSGRFSIKLNPSVVSRAAAMMILRRDGGDSGGGSGGGDAPYTPNPCSFYLLNLAIDTTIGIPILIFLLRLTTAIVSYTPLGRPAESIQSGNYGRPPNAWWWLKQSILYFCGLFGMKICVLIIFLTLPWISHVGDWALGWTDGNEQLQIIFVMMLFPLIMNGLQYYIIDSFIKDQTTSSSSSSASSSSQHGHRAGLYDHLTDSADDEDSDTDGGLSDDDVYLGSDDLVDSSDGGEGGRRRAEEVVSRKRADSVKVTAKAAPRRTAKTATATATNTTAPNPEYDPEIDGDSPTVIGSSSSQQSPRTTPAGTVAAAARANSTTLSKELFPSE